MVQHIIVITGIFLLMSDVIYSADRATTQWKPGRSKMSLFPSAVATPSRKRVRSEYSDDSPEVVARKPKLEEESISPLLLPPAASATPTPHPWQSPASSFSSSRSEVSGDDSCSDVGSYSYDYNDGNCPDGYDVTLAQEYKLVGDYPYEGLTYEQVGHKLREQREVLQKLFCNLVGVYHKDGLASVQAIITRQTTSGYAIQRTEYYEKNSSMHDAVSKAQRLFGKYRVYVKEDSQPNTWDEELLVSSVGTTIKVHPAYDYASEVDRLTQMSLIAAALDRDEPFWFAWMLQSAQQSKNSMATNVVQLYHVLTCRLNAFEVWMKGVEKKNKQAVVGRYLDAPVNFIEKIVPTLSNN